MGQGRDKEAAIRICYRSITGKEMDKEEVKSTDTETKCEGMAGMTMMPAYSYTATSFAELDAAENAQESAQEVTETAGMFQALVNNILSSPDVTDKPTALRALAGEFADRVDMAMKAKEIESKATWTAAHVNDLPDSSFLYVDPGGEKDEGGKTVPRSLRHFPVKDSDGTVDLPHLRNAIARIPQANIPADKKASLQERARKMLEEANAQKQGRRLNRDKVGFLKGLTDRMREMMKSMSEFMGWADYDDGQPEDGQAKEAKPGSLMIWKEASGAYRWFAVYSNHFRDDDNPPEIISSKSHQRFVQKVDSGEFPYPELWHWHTPGTAWGKADWVGYDAEAGFALASGTVTPGHEKEAENVANMGDSVALSHGMPKKSIQRDQADPSVITEHQTIEISDLLRPAAANKLTRFEVLKEQEMAIPDEKKEYLRQVGLSDEKIASIEQALAGKAKEAADAGIEHKEAPAETPAESVQAEEKKPETVEPAPAAPEQKAADPVADALTKMTGLLETLQKTVDAQATEIAALKAKELELTPAASLSEMIKMSVIGNKDARIPADSKLAKSGPEETKQATGLFFEQWLQPGGNFVPGKPTD